MNPPTIDYDALAAQARGQGTPPPTTPPPAAPTGAIDYDALAATARGHGAAATPPPDDSGGYSMNAIMNRVGHTPGEFVHNIGQRLTDLNTGVGQHIDRSFLTLENAAQALGVNSDTLKAQIAHDTGVVNAPRPTDPERARNVGLGDDAGALMEYMGMHKIVQGMGLMDKLEQLGPVAKVLKANPNAANVLRALVENGVTGGTQTAAQGGNAGDVALSTGVSAIAGGAAELPGAALGRAGDLAAEVQPRTQNILGQDYTVLPSEAKDPNGVSLATPLQVKAANIAREPLLRAERQAGFKSTQQNLAKRFIENAATDSNANRPQPQPVITDPARLIEPPPVDESGMGYRPGLTLQTGTPPVDVSTPPRFAPTTMQVVDPATVPNPNYQPLGGEPAAQTGATDTRTPAQERLDDLGAQGQTVPPESVTGPETIQQSRPPVYNQPQTTQDAIMVRSGGGTIKLSPNAARSLVSDLDVKLRDPNNGKRAQAALEQQHADLTDQLDRYDQYRYSQPNFAPHDVPDLVANTNSFGDAADHLRASAIAKFNALDPATDTAFRGLRQESNRYQSQFDNGNGPTKQEAMANLDDVNQRIQDLFSQPSVRSKISGTEAEQGFQEYRQSQAAKAMQNLFNRHMSYTPAEAAESGGRTNVTKNLNSFTTDLRNVETRYGDVLKPLMGDDSFSGLRDIGNLLDTPAGTDQAKDILGNAGEALRHHLSGRRGVAAAVGFGGVLAHSAATGGMGLLGGMSVLGAEGAYRMVLNRMSTDPAFARQVMYAAKNQLSPRFAGALLAATASNVFKPTQTPPPLPQQGGQQ